MLQAPSFPLPTVFLPPASIGQSYVKLIPEHHICLKTMVDATTKTYPPCYSLPAELWPQVASYFPSPRTLAIACRICKLWRSNFTPILYETFTASARGESITWPSFSGSYHGVPIDGDAEGSPPPPGRHVFHGDKAVLSHTRSLHINLSKRSSEFHPCLASRWLVENLDGMPRLQSLHVRYRAPPLYPSSKAHAKGLTNVIATMDLAGTATPT